MIEVKPNANGRSVWSWNRPLGVACLCGHRALVPLDRLGIHSGDMSKVYDRKLQCSKCGKRSVQLWIMQSDEDEREFIPSSPPPSGA